MPESTAQLNSPVIDKPVEVETELNGIRAGIGINADSALGNTGRPHNPIPVIEQPPQVLSHIPDGKTINTSGQNIPVVRGSYGETKTPLSGLSVFSEHLDYADQLVTGRDHVVGSADEFTRRKAEKEASRLAEANWPKGKSSGPIKKLIAWLHDEAA